MLNEENDQNHTICFIISLVFNIATSFTFNYKLGQAIILANKRVDTISCTFRCQDY